MNVSTPSIIRAHATRPGWTVEVLMQQETKKDGSPNRARVARPTGVQIHRHVNGHTRVYTNGVLTSEQYIGGRGPTYTGPRG